MTVLISITILTTPPHLTWSPIGFFHFGPRIIEQLTIQHIPNLVDMLLLLRHERDLHKGPQLAFRAWALLLLALTEEYLIQIFALRQLFII